MNGSLVQGFVFDDQLRIAAELDGEKQQTHASPTRLPANFAAKAE